MPTFVKLARAGDSVLRAARSRLEDVPLGRRDYPTELREEMRQRHEAGETIAELEARTGIAHGAIKFWLSAGRSLRNGSSVSTRLA